MSKKNLGEASLVTSMQQTDDILIETGGSVRRVTLEELRSAVLGDYSFNMMTDNVFILQERTTSPGVSYLISLSDWSAAQAQGEYALGVAVLSGVKNLLVAPTAGYVPFASSSKLVTTAITEPRTMFDDLEGESKTKAFLEASTSDFVTNTEDYACGFCNAYSRSTTSGYGREAGSWWLPSFGEMMIIRANLSRINYALSLIDGAEQIHTAFHWTSTERSAPSNYTYSFSSFGASFTNKTDTYRIRPVSYLG